MAGEGNNIDIKFKTSADTSGAEAAERALKQVGEEAKDAAAAMGGIDQSGVQINGIGDADTQAEKIRKLAEAERELAEARRARTAGKTSALATEVLGPDFNQKIQSGTAEVRKLDQELKRVEVSARQAAVQKRNLAQTANTAAGSFRMVGNRIQNVAFQVQDFAVQVAAGTSASRAFAQQAPQLLGSFGTWGAVIGAVVAAMPLLIKLINSSKDGTVSAEEAQKNYNEALKVYQAIAGAQGESERSVYALRAEADQQRRASLQEELQLQQSVAAAEAAREQKRITAVGGVAVAKEKLELARIEAALVTATGAQAVQLQQDRDAVVQRIVEKEQSIRDLVREQAAAQEQNKVSAAGTTAADARDRAVKASGDYDAERRERERLQEVMAKESTKRLEIITALDATIEDLRKQSANASNPLEAFGLDSKISELESRREVAMRETDAEAQATAQLAEQKKTEEAARQRAKEATAQMEEADKKLRAATEALAQLRQNQALEKATEDLKASQGQQGSTEQDAAQGARALLDQIVGALGAQAQSPDTKQRIEAVTAILADGLQASEADPVADALRGLIAKLEAENSARATMTNRVGSFFDRAVSKLSAVNDKADEAIRRLEAIETNLKN